jgi:hypothetical protein
MGLVALSRLRDALNASGKSGSGSPQCLVTRTALSQAHGLRISILGRLATTFSSSTTKSAVSVSISSGRSTTPISAHRPASMNFSRYSVEIDKMHLTSYAAKIGRLCEGDQRTAESSIDSADSRTNLELNASHVCLIHPGDR